MAVQPPASARQAEGYSKEIFGQADATTLVVGVTEVGQAQLPSNLTSGQANTIIELFSAMLTEMRQQTALLAALREPTMGEVKLRLTA